MLIRSCLIVWITLAALSDAKAVMIQRPKSTKTFLIGQVVFNRRGGAQMDDDPLEGPVVAPDTEDAPVGVRALKKSNAVGDPDGQGSDDDDDDSELGDTEWEELDVELDDIMRSRSTDNDPTVQVEVELVDEPQLPVEDDDDDDAASFSRPSGGGGGLRLGQRLQSRNKKRRGLNSNKAMGAAQLQQQLLAAWQSHVYAPPSAAAWAQLTANARSVNSASKIRLDRRTLYESLLLEWQPNSAQSRKFLQAGTSQALTAAMSLATQPVWRKSVGKHSSGILLYHAQEPDRGCTLAMQESIAMALVRVL
jgi:hypothetical protein